MRKILLLCAALLMSCGDDLGWENVKNSDADCYNTVTSDSVMEVSNEGDTQGNSEDVTPVDSLISSDSGGIDDVDDAGDVSSVSDSEGDVTETADGGDSSDTGSGEDAAPPPECVTATDCKADENPCTDTSCDSGKCVQLPNNGTCTDNNECTGGDTCQLNKCVPGLEVNCDDLNPCTDDTCDPKAGCVHLPNTVTCTDNDKCTEGDVCDLGVCVPGKLVDCDDTDPCTDDSCNPQVSCIHMANSATCTDDSVCTVNDLCKEGTCKPGDVKSCDDLNPCTNDSCDKVLGCVNLPNTVTCTDNNACTLDDVCKDAVCTGVQAICDDGQLCTDDSCDPLVGCVNLANSVTCTDGDDCTVDDVCKDGKCKSGDMMVCPSAQCVVSSCDKGKCVDDKEILNDVKCDDGKLCTTLAKCLDGKCLTANSKNCDDANSCTLDACNAVTGDCVHKPTDEIPCDDGSKCSLNDTCIAGICKSGPVDNCSDNNPCTVDSCSILNGCFHTDAKDDTPCGKDSVCITGVCKVVQTCGDVDSDGDGTNDKCDCEPLNKFVAPNLPEVCDGADNNCNGQVDEGQVCGTTGIVQVTAINGSTKVPMKDVVINVKPAGKCSASADLAPAIKTATTTDTGKSTLKPDPGNYCIEATLAGFKKAITNDFSIASGEVRPLLLPLIPSTVGDNLISVCGLVTDATTKLPVTGASVSVAVNSADNVVGTAKSDVTGLYCVVGIKGVTNAIITAVADGYVSATKNIAPPTNGVGIVQDFELAVSVAGICYQNDFEEGLTGWTIDPASAGNQWQVIDNAVPVKNKDYPLCVNVWPSEKCVPNPNDISDSCQICGNPQQLACIPSAGSLPRSYKGTHALWYGSPTTGNFNGTSGNQCGPQSGGNGPANGGTITAPEQVLQNGTSSYILKFAYWYEIEGVAPQYPTFDSMNIYVSLNGGAFAPVGHLNPSTSFGYQGPDAYTSGGGGQAPAWGVREIALTSAKAGDKLKVKFEFKTGDGAFNAFRGWVIDDMKVVGAGCK